MRLGPDGMPYDFRIQDLRDDEFEVADMTKEEKLDTIDALVFDIHDYRKEVDL